MSFIGTTNHLMRLGTNSLNIIFLQPSGNVYIGSSNDTHKLYIDGTLRATEITGSAATLSSLGIATSNTTTNSSLASDYALSLINPISTNGNQVGMIFGISGNASNLYTGGASIVHQRSDTNSIGLLRFNIRTSSGALDPLIEAFRINDDASTTFNYPMTIDGNLIFTGASRTITGLSSISATTIAGTLSTGAQTAITSLGTLSALTVSGSASLGSIQISGTEIITSGRHIQNIGDITCSGTMNAFDGYQVNGSTFTYSARNVFAASVIGVYAQLDKTSGSVYSSTQNTNL